MGSVTDVYTIVWVAVAVIMGIVEGVTVSLVSIWFILGALVSLVLNLLGFSVAVQGIAFVVVSLLSLLIIRPIMSKQNHMKSSHELNSLIDRECTIVDCKEFTDCIVDIDGAKWNAVFKPGTIAYKGDKATVIAVQGNKLIIQGVSIDSLTGVDDCE